MCDTKKKCVRCKCDLSLTAHPLSVRCRECQTEFVKLLKPFWRYEYLDKKTWKPARRGLRLRIASVKEAVATGNLSDREINKMESDLVSYETKLATIGKRKKKKKVLVLDAGFTHSIRGSGWTFET